MLDSYSKIWNLGHRELFNLCSHPVVIQEKIDGSQLTFGLIDGELQFRSKNQAINPDAPGMFELGVKAVLERQFILEEGLLYRGEFLSKPKHNTLKYERVPVGNIVLFDIEVASSVGTEFCDPEELEVAAKRMKLDVVPCYFNGRIALEDIEDVCKETLKERKPLLGGSMIEGLVIKSRYGAYGIDSKSLMGKYVQDVFRELHKKNPEYKTGKSADVITAIVETIANDARRLKAVQTLRDRGLLTDSVKDIGPLIGAQRADIMDECEDIIMDALLKWATPLISRRVGGGMAEWYKEYLRLPPEEQHGE